MFGFGEKKKKDEGTAAADVATNVPKSGGDANGADGVNGGSDSNNDAAVHPVSDSEIVCPPHTTESKLMWKVDYHVVPCLCVMYLLAFLGESSRWGDGVFFGASQGRS